MLMPGEGDPVGDGLGDLGGVGKGFGGWPQSAGIVALNNIDFY